MKRFLFFLTLVLSLASTLNAVENKKTTLSACIYGYRGDMVYFDCAQTPFIKKEFHTNPGEEHVYNFETNALVSIIINGKTTVVLEPGDSLHVNVQYDNNKIASLDFSGSEGAVVANKILSRIAEYKVDIRYKKQLLGSAVLDIKPKVRIEDSRRLLKKTKEFISEHEGKISDDVADYILAGVEADAYMSFMEYPVMYSAIRKVPMDELEISDYWALMDGFKVMDSVGALSNESYPHMLMRYCFYENEKTAIAKGETYTMPAKFEEMYEQLAQFYEGQVRDCVLFRLINNFIQGGKEIERADVVFEDYKEKYNLNPEYLKILTTLLQ